MNNRLQNLKLLLTKNKLDAILVSSTVNIIYLTNFTGFSKEEREGYLLITKNKQYVFTDSRYFEAVRKYLPKFGLIEISKNNTFKQELKKLVSDNKINKLAIDLDDINVAEFKNIRSVVKVVSDNELIEDLRVIKDSLELKEIQKACLLGDKIFEQILKKIKVGVTEVEIAKQIEILTLLSDASLSFQPIAAFGNNCSLIHHVPTNKKLTNNSIVLLDFGVKVNNYCSDMTRTFFIGIASKKQKEIYNTVLEAQQKAAKYFSTSKKLSDIDLIARNYILSKNYPTIPHSLGHGIGLEVHEKHGLSPKSKEIIKKGMVFSIEPGIYIPNFGGVRIEDLYFYDGKNAQLISHANKGIIEL